MVKFGSVTHHNVWELCLNSLSFVVVVLVGVGGSGLGAELMRKKAYINKAELVTGCC